MLLPRGAFRPLPPFIFLVLLSSLTSAFKVYFPIASGSNMSVSYVVDIACLILRGPHATMVLGAASGWSQTTLNSKAPNPAYRTLFNMAILVITVQCAGQVYRLLGGTAHPQLGADIVVPLGCMALTYFFVNTIPIAFAIAFTTEQSAWRIWKTDFASSAPTYLLGALAAAVVISVTESSGYWLTMLLTAAPLYLTYKMYRAGVASILSQLVREERLSVIDALAVDSPKTKLFAQKMKGYGFDGTVLVVTDKLDDNIYLGSRNLPNVLVLETREVDPVTLVRFQHVLLTKAAVAQFEEILG